MEAAPTVDGAATHPAAAEILERLSRHLSTEREAALIDALQGRSFEDKASVWRAALSVVAEGDRVMLSRPLHFGAVRGLATILDEILVAEEYFFPGMPADARIIDAGANFGLATYFFKRLCNKARITAIEPNPTIAALYRKNAVARYADVELIEGALSDVDGDATFWFSESEDLASSLDATRAPGDSAPKTVRTVALRSLLAEPVDLLKIDVEGVEVAALEGARDRLDRVGRVVCECHGFKDGRPNTLSGVLSILEDAGFRTAAVRARWDEDSSRFRFGGTLAKRRSYVVYGDRPD